MQNKLERLIKIVYKKWKLRHPETIGEHPDEETFACFLEGRLTAGESELIKAHIIKCDACADFLEVQIKSEKLETKEAPPELVERLKKLIGETERSLVLQVLARLKEKCLEILNTTGEVLVNNEVMPQLVLRSRKIKDFKDEVTILKEFGDIRVEVKIENKDGRHFNLTVLARDRGTQRIVKDLRITLVKDDLELESYSADLGKVAFEHVLLGKYTVEIFQLEEKLASIFLDIII